jgi:hypothetical protein
VRDDAQLGIAGKVVLAVDERVREVDEAHEEGGGRVQAEALISRRSARVVW